MVWTYLRHYINIVILYSIITTFRTIGPFELNWDTQQYKCWISQYITFALLASLQILNMFWTSFIIRIAWNMVFRHIEKDVRSDDEDDDDELEEVGEKGHGEKASSQSLSNGLQEAIDERKELPNGLGIDANGTRVPNGHESYADAVIEGKKER